MFEDFIDKRNREWEWFTDESYYGFTCVRLKEDRNFNSECSFHFETLIKANEFVKLIKGSR